MKRKLVDIAIRIGILFAILVSFIMGHALSIIVGIRHYNAMGIMVYYGIAYCISFIVGVWYVLTKTPKLGWNRTLRNGLAVSLVLGFILVTILGIPISE